MTTATAKEIADAYRMHLILTGRSKAGQTTEMTLEELKEKIRNMSDSEMVTVLPEAQDEAQG